MSFITNKATGTLPGKGVLLIFKGNITLGKVKFAMKHSAGSKPLNQQINEKEEKGQKRDIAFE